MKTILREHKNSALGLLFSIFISIAVVSFLPGVFHRIAHPINIVIGVFLVFLFCFLVLRNFLWRRTRAQLQLSSIPDASLYELENERKVKAEEANQQKAAEEKAEREIPPDVARRLKAVENSGLPRVTNIAHVIKAADNTRKTVALKHALNNMKIFFSSDASLTFEDNEAQALLQVYILALHQRLTTLGAVDIHEDPSMKAAMILQDFRNTRMLPQLNPKYLDSNYKLPVAQLVK